jgi:hypothetical protein
MKSAEAFIETLKQGISPEVALASLRPYEPPFLAGVPAKIYLLATQFGWKFFPVEIAMGIREATCDPAQLKCWARARLTLALATGPSSGALVLEVDGHGQSSLLALCQDDWDWLDTFRSIMGSKRYLYFAWPRAGKQICVDKRIGEGLRILGEGDWVVFPFWASRETSGLYNHACLNPQLTIMQTPAWLLDLIIEPAFQHLVIGGSSRLSGGEPLAIESSN